MYCYFDEVSKYYTAKISSSKNTCEVFTELVLKPTESDPVRITALERKSRSKSKLKPEMILRLFEKYTVSSDLI